MYQAVHLLVTRLVLSLCLLILVFHTAPPSSDASLARQTCGSAPQQPSPTSFTALTSSRLQDKHQKLREGRRLSSFLPSLLPNPHPSFPSSADLHHFLCHDEDFAKPKGKRPCKTKHTEGEASREEETDGGGANLEEKNGKVIQQHSRCCEKFCFFLIFLFV